MSWVNIILIAAFAVVVIGAILRLVQEHRCPECRQNWALQKTGTTENGTWFTAEREEWKCEYCGYRAMKSKHYWGIGH